MSLAAALVTLGFTTCANAQEDRSIALILDASGSMNARLASGGTRIDAAKAAVAAFVAKLDPNVRISYRAYGHQSPTKARDCKDTELLVGNVSSFVSRMPVPPGQYTIEIEKQKIPLDLAEGQRMEINVK